MSSHTTPRWGARIGAALGIVALGAAAFTAPAFAVDPVYGNIDPNASGSITIHKHEHQSGADAPISGDPQAPGTTLDNPIAGVVFTAYKLTDFSVTDAADWTALSTLVVPADACETPALTGWTLDVGTELAPTNDTGVTTLDLTNASPAQPNADLGAYLICETNPPAGSTDTAVPFVVTVPFPDNQSGAPSNSDGWLYNVHAYPKNGLAPTITKSVGEQTALGLGSTATFDVVTTVPRIADGNQFNSYTIVDPLDPRLTATEVKSVTLSGSGGLVLGTHYTVVRDRNVLMVNFTQAGLTLLKANGGQSITTVFSGTVDSIDPVAGFGLGAGEIYNIAYLVTDNEPGSTPPSSPPTPPLTPGDPDEPVDPGEPFAPEVPSIPSNPVTQNWGDIKVFKYDAGDGSTALNGAVFEVYEAAAPYAATCSTDISTTNADPIEVAGQTTFTSTAGLVLVPGLFVSDSSNAPVDNPTRCYVLKETAAPAGFVTPTGATALLAVQVATGQTAVTGGELASYDGSVGNVKSDVPDLPLTGADGQLVLMVLGGGLVLVAFGAAIVARRRKAKQTH